MNNTVEILLVEDTASDAELTLHVLTRHRVFDATAGSIQMVRDHAERGSCPLPKLLLLDLKLPKVSGLEVLRRAKADVHTCGIPVGSSGADGV